MNNTHRWDIGSAMLTLFLFKIFTSFPKSLVSGAGDGAWISVLLSGTIFFVISCVLANTLKRKNIMIYKNKVVQALLLIYIIASAGYTVFEGVTAIKMSAYPNTPIIFLLFFVILGGIIPALCGRDGVMRLMGIVAPFLAVFSALIIAFGLKGAEAIYLFPVFGNGAVSIIKEGFCGIFAYLDILLLPLILIQYDEEINIKKPLIISSAVGIAFYIFGIFAILLSTPYEAFSGISLPLYELSRNTYGGETFQRLDLLYLVSLCISLISSLGIYFYLFGTVAKGFKVKKILPVFLCVILSFSLFGCADSREVEENAYLIALGIDKGETEAYKYTFMFANQPENNSEDEDTPKCIVKEGTDFHTALSHLKRSLGKEPNLTHLSVVAFSPDVAKEGVKNHIDAFERDREIRPNTKLVLATDGAENWIESSNPRFEESIARYYKLLLRPSAMPYAPVEELHKFKNDLAEKGIDPVMPIAVGDEIVGIACFSGDKMVKALSGDEAVLYNLFMGKNDGAVIAIDNVDLKIKSRRKGNITVNNGTVNVTLFTETEPFGAAKNEEAIKGSIERNTQNLIYTLLADNSDIFGIKRAFKKKCDTQKEWQKASQNKNLWSKLNVSVKNKTR